MKRVNRAVRIHSKVWTDMTRARDRMVAGPRTCLAYFLRRLAGVTWSLNFAVTSGCSLTVTS